MDIVRRSQGLTVRRMMGERLGNWIRTSNNRAVLRVRSLLGQPHVLFGKVSVVVPIYNVEQYLEECLESIRIQNYPDLEVLMINDGSKDSSVEIARMFAKKDRRFKLVTKSNAGLGAARNTGIMLATGRFITFVDSDDAIPYDAYRNMVTALVQSGSDFVVGGVERWRGQSRWRDAWAARVHARDQFGLTLDDLPEVTKDVFAWNKLFRANFFKRVVGGFPESILYEDQEATAKAFVGASAFDVLGTTTYFWRIREDGTSITQNKLAMKDLNDRIAVAQAVGEVYRERASREIYQYWLAKTAGEDFAHYYRLADRGGSEYWARLVELTRFLFASLTASTWSEVHSNVRILAYLLSTNDAENFSRVLAAQAQYPSGVPSKAGEQGYCLDIQRWGISEVDLPREVSTLSEKDTALRTGFYTVQWLEGGTLQVEGFAYVDNLQIRMQDSSVSIQAISEGKAPVQITLERFSASQEGLESPRNSYVKYDDAAFRFRLDPQELAALGDSFSLSVEVRTGDVTRVGRLVPQNSENELRLAPYAHAEQNKMFVVSANQLDGLVVKSVDTPVSVLSLVVGRYGEVAFSLKFSDRTKNARVYAQNRARSIQIAQDVQLELDGARGTATLAVPQDRSKEGTASRWELSIDTDHGTFAIPYPGGLLEDLNEAARGALGLRFSETGAMELADATWAMTIASISSTLNGLRIDGHYDSTVGELPKLVLARLDGTLIENETLRVDIEERSFHAEFNLRGDPVWGRPYVSLTSGVFGVCVMPKDAQDVFSSSRVLHFDSRSRNGDKHLVSTPSGFASITDYGVFRSALVKLSGPLAHSAPDQPVTRDDYEDLRERALNRPILSRVVLCNSFSGTSVHDSPRPVAEAMLEAGLVDEIVWVVADNTLDGGPDGRTVALGSSEFVDVLHRAKFLVNSAHFPHYFRKRDGQVYVQTWHGTPLKKIHNDVPPTSLSNQYRDLMAREVSYWDVLLAQSAEAGELLSKAFGFEGPLVTAGYPRNDVQFDARRMQALRERFREKFNIGDDAIVALYAPTWRDNAMNTITTNGYEQLEVTRLLDGLGANSRLLLRGHANTLGFGRRVMDDRVLDVSGHSDLGQLFAASDLLITDYSSIFFDYAVSGKPILGFAPDLESYSSTLRGMYFGYSDVFPGQIARTNDELMKLLPTLGDQEYVESPILSSILESEQGNAATSVVEWLKSGL